MYPAVTGVFWQVTVQNSLIESSLRVEVMTHIVLNIDFFWVLCLCFEFFALLYIWENTNDEQMGSHPNLQADIILSCSLSS